jgi:hypothetical protein
MKATHCVVMAIEQAIVQNDARLLEDLYDAGHQLFLVLIDQNGNRREGVPEREFSAAIARLESALLAIKELQK